MEESDSSASASEHLHPAPLPEGGGTSQPGIYRGWLIAAVTFASLGATLGTAQYAFQAFIIPLEEHFGWSRTQVNASLTFAVLGSLGAPFMGRLLDKIGARWIMTVSLGAIAIGFFLRAIMTELWQFYLFSALIFVTMSGSTNLPVGRLVSLWFAKTRGRMMGFVTAGNNFGGLVSLPIVAWLIVEIGWRRSFAAIGIGMLVILVLVFLVVRDRREDVEREQGKRWAPKGDPILEGRRGRGESGFTVNQAVHLRAFWLLLVGVGLQQFARTTVATQLVPHFENVGLTTAAAVVGASLLAFCAMSSKIIFGWLSERMTAIYAYVVIIALQVVGVGMLAFVGGSFLAWPGVIIFGLGMGGVGALMPLAVAETFGLKNFGSIMGLTNLAVILPTIVGPLMAGAVYDSRGSYELAFLATACLLAVSMVLFFLAAPRWSKTPSLPSDQ